VTLAPVPASKAGKKGPTMPIFATGRGLLPTLASAAIASSVILAAPEAHAQRPAPRPKEAPAPPPPPAPAPEPKIPDLMAAVPGGITAEQVGVRAAQTSYVAKASEETSYAAEARTDAARAGFLPRLQLTGRYTRLSGFTPPAFGSAQFRSVVTTDAAGTSPVDLANTQASGGVLRFPLVLNQWLAQASLIVPISDYLLRINQNYTAATRQEEAARYDLQAERAKAYSDGKIAYYTWLRSRGSLTVAEQSLAVAKAHLRDSENLFSVGSASKADVLRAQTQVSSAELLVERAKNGITIAERNVRVATHAKEDEKLEPGESIDAQPPAAPRDLRNLVSQAIAARPEVKSIDRNAEATRKLASVQKAGRYPTLTAQGDVIYGNPNPRVFPQRQEGFTTWAISAQITWSPNDVITAGGNAADLDARAAALDAERIATRDAIELEVNQHLTAVLEADFAIQTTTRQLESAEEAYRVARELFTAGRGTSTTLFDAEVALAQARFEHLNAKVDARLARIRLDHALGRDVK
jgi:outer membrane protein TolC